MDEVYVAAIAPIMGRNLSLVRGAAPRVRVFDANFGPELSAGSPGHATIAVTRCPFEPGPGSFRHSHRPSSEGALHVDTLGKPHFDRWIEASPQCRQMSVRKRYATS
jgi:hypothetical protein